MAAKDDFTRRLKESGIRLTAPRLAVAETLSAVRDHPDVEELHRRIKKAAPRISLATVYRTLQLFQKLGIVEKHDFGDNRARYESGMHEHHDHFIDVKTGKVMEFHSPEIEALQNKIAARHGFRIVSHRLDIYVEPIRRAPAKKPRK